MFNRSIFHGGQHYSFTFIDFCGVSILVTSLSPLRSVGNISKIGFYTLSRSSASKSSRNSMNKCFQLLPQNFVPSSHLWRTEIALCMSLPTLNSIVAAITKQSQQIVFLLYRSSTNLQKLYMWYQWREDSSCTHFRSDSAQIRGLTFLKAKHFSSGLFACSCHYTLNVSNGRYFHRL